MLAKADVDSNLIAPFADTPIELSMLSTSSSRYKTYYCIECRHPFLQRDGDTLYRINSEEEPGVAHFSGGVVLMRCAKCSQKYVGNVSVVATRTARTVQMQALQTLYIIPTALKVERYIRCLDCGGSFLTITDQVTRIVDNSLPLEYASPDHIGTLETRCKINTCRQRWALHV